MKFGLTCVNVAIFLERSLQSEQGTAVTFWWSLLVFGSVEESYLFICFTYIITAVCSYRV